MTQLSQIAIFRYHPEPGDGPAVFHRIPSPSAYSAPKNLYVGARPSSRRTRENDVKFICLCFSEILGNLKGFALTLEELESAMTRGVGFDGPSIEGFARSDECDLYALPDTHTFNIVPWNTRTNEVARRLGDFRTQGDEPFEGT